MKTDSIIISNDGGGMKEALIQAEKAAVFKELAKRDALHLRLLTEEMLGMMRSITGERTGRFWIEDQDGVFRLYLQVHTPMDSAKQERLLAASKSGKNDAAKGVMGRIRAFFEPIAWTDTPVSMQVDGMQPSMTWSMNAYRQNVKEELENDREGAAEAWDELEKSVVSNIADDVRVSIRGHEVEMVILKKVG